MYLSVVFLAQGITLHVCVHTTVIFYDLYIHDMPTTNNANKFDFSLTNLSN